MMAPASVQRARIWGADFRIDLTATVGARCDRCGLGECADLECGRTAAPFGPIPDSVMRVEMWDAFTGDSPPRTLCPLCVAEAILSDPDLEYRSDVA